MVRTTAVFDLIHLSEKLTLDSATQAHNLEDWHWTHKLEGINDPYIWKLNVCI
jgi:hypothetical protein